MTKSSLKKAAYRIMYGGRADRRRVKRVKRIVNLNLDRYGNPWGPGTNLVATAQELIRWGNE